jgi:putative membrane protein
MKTKILTFVLGVSLSFVPAFAEDLKGEKPVTNTSAGEPATATDVAADTRFMENATQINWTEVKLGELARSRTQRADVKAYAELIIQHHKNAQQSLKDIMNKVNASLPKDITTEQQASIDDLKRTGDADFDRMFVKRMVMDHQKGVALYESFIGSTKSPELKNYANITIDHMKLHLQKAEELSKAIGGVAAK